MYTSCTHISITQYNTKVFAVAQKASKDAPNRQPLPLPLWPHFLHSPSPRSLALQNAVGNNGIKIKAALKTRHHTDTHSKSLQHTQKEPEAAAAAAATTKQKKKNAWRAKTHAHTNAATITITANNRSSEAADAARATATEQLRQRQRQQSKLHARSSAYKK